MSWTQDAPGGVYNNHALSQKIRAQAVANSVATRWAMPEPNYGKRRGEQITITRVDALGDSVGTVSEFEHLPEGRPSINNVSVTATEKGFKIPCTEREKNFTFFDLRNPFQRALRDQFRLRMDSDAIAAFQGAQNTYCTTSGTAGTHQTNGSFSGTATDQLSVEHIGEIYDILYGTQKAPKFSNGTYVGLLSPNAARSLKNDSTYREWISRTGNATDFRQGRLGNVQGFELFETNHIGTNGLDNVMGSNDVGEAVFFGMDPIFVGMVDDPEIRSSGPLKEDLGRFEYVGWVGTWGMGRTYGDDVTQDRIIRFGSA